MRGTPGNCPLWLADSTMQILEARVGIELSHVVDHMYAIEKIKRRNILILSKHPIEGHRGYTKPRI
jgi:hypothetical protein